MLKSQKHRTTLGKKKSKRFFVINNFDERMEMIRQKFGASSLSLSLSLQRENIDTWHNIYIYALANPINVGREEEGKLHKDDEVQVNKAVNNSLHHPNSGTLLNIQIPHHNASCLSLSLSEINPLCARKKKPPPKK